MNHFKYKFFLLSIIYLIAFSNNLMAATLKFEEGITPLIVNGETPKSVNVFEKQDSIALKSGINQILVTYTAEIKRGSDSELATTQPTVLLFEASSGDMVLTAPKIQSISSFRTFEKTPSWRLNDQNEQPVNFKSDTLVKHGFQLNRDFKQELNQYNLSNKKASLYLPPNIARPAVNGKGNTSYNSQSDMAGQMLMYWYQQANEMTRQKFKALITQ